MTGRNVARARTGCALGLAGALACVAPASGAGLADFFRTPDERAARALDSEAGRAALEASGDTEWTGHARYAAGDAAAAAAAFEATLADETDPDERHRLRYNRATALARAGRYDEAIDAFDALLDEVPDDVDAAANRDVARRLAALEEPPAGNEGQDGTPGEDGQDGSPEAGDPDGSPEAGDPDGDPDGGQDGGQDGEDADQGGRGDQRERGEEDGRQGDDASDARAALEAVDAADPGDAADDASADAEREPRDASGDTAEPGDTPLDEREQAIEQWLSNIPDDPAGLLRRKLVQSHRRDWPDVRSDGDAW